MKILTAAYWQAGLHNVISHDSIMLKMAESRHRSFVLALVCEGKSTPLAGEIFSGYMTEEIINWFNENHLPAIVQRKSIRKIKRDLYHTYQKINNELSKYAEKNDFNYESSFVLLALSGKKYLIIQAGAAKIYKIRFNIKQLITNRRCLKKNKAVQTCIGKFRRGDGILLCSNNFSNNMKKRTLLEALKPSDIKKEIQITKRLREVADYAVRKGETGDISALYIKIT